MPIFDLFSKRKKIELGEVFDVYQYDNIPDPLRVQIVHIWRDALGDHENIHSKQTVDAYIKIVEPLRREYGVFSLLGDERYPVCDAPFELIRYFLNERNTDKVIDVIELAFRYIDLVARHYERSGQWLCSEVVLDEAIDELNVRLKDHGVGYCYSNGRIIRIDSEFIHSEVVKPVLIVLRQSGHENAEREFLGAYEHYRHGRNSEALVDACKAFESVMKIIATKHGWGDVQNKPAAQLVDMCWRNNLIPVYWQTHFSGLRQILESATPTPRNKTAGHGAGAALATPPSNELTGYVLHMTASTILFLTEAEKAL